MSDPAESIADGLVVHGDGPLKDEPLLIRAGLPVHLEDRVTDAEGNSVALETRPVGVLLPPDEADE